jgi:hypothetical protein
MVTAPSLLFLPNEGTEGDQVGPREAFAEMAAQGLLSRLEVYSYLVEASRHGAETALDRLRERVATARPDVLLWQHVSDFPVTSRHLATLRAASPHTHLLYHEGDVYGRWAKRFPGPTRVLMAAADTVALVGAGEYAALARSAGARRVIYSPQSADTRRFGTPWTPTAARDFDVVMIGSRVTSRRPWGRMPGAASRERLVQTLGRSFGNRFAVFGHGWAGFAGDHGPLPFSRQEEAHRRAWVTVSWDHFDTVERYFSDRIPISLLSGVPHVTNHQPGYEQVFGPEAPLSWAQDVNGLVAEVERLLALGGEALNELGRRAQAYARERFTARVVYQALLRETLSRSEPQGVIGS